MKDKTQKKEVNGKEIHEVSKRSSSQIEHQHLTLVDTSQGNYCITLAIT